MSFIENQNQKKVSFSQMGTHFSHPTKYAYVVKFCKKFCIISKIIIRNNPIWHDDATKKNDTKQTFT